jgi:hypothetical protein
MARIMASEDQAAREPRVLIEGRNERCLAVLQRELAAGRKNLGVYYGAAHMEHLERRLCQDLGFGRIDEQWLVAWDCSADRAPAQEKGLQQKRYRARRDLEVLHAAVLAWRAADHDGGLPSWDALRRAQPGGKLPGRADGLDPWGREYVLRASGGGFELRSCGSDGKPDTEDDVTWTPGG